MQITKVAVKPYDAPVRGEPKDARQVIFVICVDNETCDLLYNAPDGLRGRYWQTPDYGHEATKYLIRSLIPRLLSFAHQDPPPIIKPAAPMDMDDIEASLKATSAKIWPRERDDSLKIGCSPISNLRYRVGFAIKRRHLSISACGARRR